MKGVVGTVAAVLVLILSFSAVWGSTDLTVEREPDRTIFGPAPADRGYFIENQGQWDDKLLFVGVTDFGSMGVGEYGVYYHIVEPEKDDTEVTFPVVAPPSQDPIRSCTLFMEFVDCYPSAPRGTSPLSHSTNFLVGNDPTRWASNIISYERVLYEDLWAGIDLEYRIEGGCPKYEFKLDPGADPEKIGIRVHGHSCLNVGPDSVSMELPTGGTLEDSSLLSFYGDGPGGTVGSSFTEKGTDTFGFGLRGYDRSRPVTIDPLVYSTYFGGGGDETVLKRGAVDGGSIYFGGRTYSTDLPTTPGAYRTARGGLSDGYVVKFDPTGKNILACTYFGGSHSDQVTYVMVDGSGYVYLTLYGQSSDIPTTAGAYDTDLNGEEDIYVVKMDSDLSSVIYCTYIGSEGSERPLGADLGPDGSVSITGYTFSANYPVTPDCYDDRFGGTSGYDVDVILTRLNPQGSDLIFSTFLGGPKYEIGWGLDVDGDGNIYMAGYTSSTLFPTTTGAYDTEFNGPSTDTYSDLFVTVFPPSGSAPIYSTFIGGTGRENCNTIRAGDDGSAYITGYTLSTDFPVTDSVQTLTDTDHENIYLCRISPSGDSLLFSTLLGGSEDEVGMSLAVDRSSRVFLGGSTYSGDLPTTDNCIDSTNNGYRDIFIMMLDTERSSLDYCTYLGSSASEGASYLHSYGNGTILGLSATSGADFPVTTGCYDDTPNGGGDAVMFMIKPSAPPLEPADLAALLTKDHIDLDWTPPAWDGGFAITGYRVYRGTAESEMTLRAELSQTYFRDEMINLGASYYYCVSAVSSMGESLRTEPVFITDDVPPSIVEDRTQGPGVSGERIEFDLLVEDDVAVRYVYVEYRLGNSGSRNVTMADNGGGAWTREVSLDGSYPSLTYSFSCVDHYGNWVDSDERTIELTDRIKPTLNHDPPSYSAECGKDILLTLRALDNREVDSSYLIYDTGEGEKNVTMDRAGVDMFEVRFLIPETASGPLTYHFSAVDTSGNWNHTGIFSKGILDGISPILVVDRSPENATTGDPYDLALEVNDNREVDRVELEYRFGSGERTRVSMVENRYFMYGIDIPDSLSPLYYTVTMIDASENTNTTPERKVVVLDDDPPELGDITSPGSVGTGGSLSISVEAYDNVGMEEVTIFYGFGKTDNRYNMAGDGPYTCSFQVPFDSLMPFRYRVSAADTSGNIREREGEEIAVLDTIPPEIVLVGDMVIREGEFLNVTLDISDNIEVVSIEWEGVPTFHNWDAISGRVKEPGLYRIDVTVKDGAENSARISFNVSVLPLEVEQGGVEGGGPNLNWGLIIGIVLFLLFLVVLGGVGTVLLIYLKGSKKGEKGKEGPTGGQREQGPTGRPSLPGRSVHERGLPPHGFGYPQGPAAAGGQLSGGNPYLQGLGPVGSRGLLPAGPAIPGAQVPNQQDYRRGYGVYGIDPRPDYRPDPISRYHQVPEYQNRASAGKEPLQYGHYQRAPSINSQGAVPIYRGPDHE